MLDAIADFWKPAKKSQTQIQLQPDLLQVGSSLGFGFVPQALLSGRRLHVIGINTYVFGDEKLTSFVLAHDKDPNASGPNISMIVAESEGEYYLAISRRVSINDRSKLFDSGELSNVMSRSDTLRLSCRDNVVDFKGWVVGSYKREIQGLKGSLIKGDFRKSSLPSNRDDQSFEYTLLVSDSNEHAIEIEKYGDGRFEVYATVYRRMGDVGEITHPTNGANSAPEKIRSDIKLAAVAKEPLPVTTPEVPVTKQAEAAKFEAKAEQKTEAAPEIPPIEPIKLQELTPPEKPQEKLQEKAPEQPAAKAAEEKSLPMNTTQTTPINGATNTMSTAEALKPKLYVQSNAETSENSFGSDAIECDLRVANKIIDEAIRNEMRLTDVVRRIIELPVANPESVQIPLTLTDEDYALLAIRYGISASDRNAIKRRIIADLGDFSGEKKKAA